MKKRIWIISELYYPEESATGFILTKIAEGLSQHYDVYALCCKRGGVPPNRELLDYEVHNNVKIYRSVSTTLNKDVVFFRLINLITSTISIFLKAVMNITSGDYVLVVTNPPTLPFLITIASRFRNARCLLLIHDVYPEALIAAGMLKSDAVLSRILNVLSKWLYNSVEHIVVLGRDMQRLVLHKVSMPLSKVSIITNWGDIDIITPSEKEQNELVNQLQLNNRFIVQYVGNMGRTHGLENILNVADKLSIEKDIYLLIIGSGAKKKWVESTLRQKGLKNVILLSPRPRKEQNIFLNACDVSIISFVSGMAGVSVPSRMYNILSAGKPIIAIADADSELAKVVSEEKIGWVISPERAETLSTIILEARSKKETLEEMGKKSRFVAEQKYTFPKIMESYFSLFDKLNNIK